MHQNPLGGCDPLRPAGGARSLQRAPDLLAGLKVGAGFAGNPGKKRDRKEKKRRIWKRKDGRRDRKRGNEERKTELWLRPCETARVRTARSHATHQCMDSYIIAENIGVHDQCQTPYLTSPAFGARRNQFIVLINIERRRPAPPAFDNDHPGRRNIAAGCRGRRPWSPRGGRSCTCPPRTTPAAPGTGRWERLSVSSDWRETPTRLSRTDPFQVD